MKDAKIYKLKFFVNCEGWTSGGYENCIFVFSKKEAKEWLDKNPDCDFVSLEKISKEEFVKDCVYECV